MYEVKEQLTHGKLSIVFSPGEAEASGEEFAIKAVTGKEYDFHATKQSYTDPLSWKSLWDGLAYEAEVINIPETGSYKDFYASLEKRGDVAVFPAE